MIVHSSVVKSMALRYGYQRKNLMLIPLCIDFRCAKSEVAVEAPVSNSPHLVTVGGVTHTKGQLDIIRVLPRIKQVFPDVVYHIIGEIRDNSYLRCLLRTAEQLGVDENVLISTTLSEDEKKAVLQRADLYVQPSHEEGFCLAFLEAAMVVPRMVGVDTGAMSLVGGDDAGVTIIPPRRIDLLGGAISSLMSKKLDVRLMEERMARLSRVFSPDVYIARHEALYVSLVSRLGS